MCLTLVCASYDSISTRASEAASQQPDSTRYVNGQVLISKLNPELEIRFQPDFKFVGSQSFILFENAEVTQFYFARIAPVNKIKALFTIQFENYVPGAKQVYNYRIKDSIDINGVSFLHSPVYNQPIRVLQGSTRSDVWYRFSYLESIGYQLPNDVVGHRFIRLIDETKQKEILVIYNEDIKNTGTTPTELENDKEKFKQVSDSLFKNALKAFEINHYK